MGGRKGDPRRPISGTFLVAQLRSGRHTVGWKKENRLGYIEKIMTAGWLQQVEAKAVNKVMKQAEMRMVRNFERKAGRR